MDAKINELKKAKAETEQRINKILNDFANKYQLEDVIVDFERLWVRVVMNNNEKIALELKIKIKIGL